MLIDCTAIDSKLFSQRFDFLFNFIAKYAQGTRKTIWITLAYQSKGCNKQILQIEKFIEQNCHQSKLQNKVF